MIDVGPLATDLGFEPVSLTLRTFGTSTANRFGEHEETATDTTLVAVVHPSGRRELQRLGLDFLRETISVYSNTEIVGGGATRPAELLYETRWYQVVRVGNYERMGNMWLVHASLLDRDQDSPP